ncbi:XRE family transcriptional regulator [bacterium]|nr:MAG: XRE family transcriptional regulator [bacterium]
MSLGTRLKALRGSRSKADFARELGITPDYVRMLEGDEKHPGQTLLELFCLKYSINKDWLLTGIGWASSPSSSWKAEEWITEKFEGSDISKAFILTYHDGLGGCANGFILDTKRGVLSMEGGSTRSGYTGGGPNIYRKILEKIKGKGLPVYVRRFKANETPAWNKTDLSELLAGPDIGHLDIEAELRYLRPDLYSEEKLLEKELSTKYPEDEKLINLVKKLERIYKEGNLKERAEVRGIIEEVYDELAGKLEPAANENIKKDRAGNGD